MSIKLKTKVVYEPRGQAKEYAALAANLYRGCGHGCVYCYCPALLKMSYAEFNSTAVPRKNFIELLEKDAEELSEAGITDQILFCFTTDPYHPCDTSLTRKALETLIKHGLSFCTLTKGGTRALRDIDLFRKNHDAFATTLTCLDDTMSRKWERFAALPNDRISTLKKFHDNGIFTWVSLEPTLDTTTSLEIIRETHEFVDLYKIGRANYLPITYSTDWRKYVADVIELCSRLNVKHYIKKDLQQYLPRNYHNPLRIPQHH